MKMGFITSLLDGWSYEEMIDEVARIGIQCVEVACWPKGKAERKYGGVTHIEIDRVLEDDEYARHILDYAKEKGVDICALAYYPTISTPTPSGARCSMSISSTPSTLRQSLGCPRSPRLSAA